MTDLSSDKEGLTGELDAILAYLDKLKPQCETKVPSYAERKAAREQEIEGLKSALEILEAPAALLQTGRQLRRCSEMELGVSLPPSPLHLCCDREQGETE